MEGLGDFVPATPGLEAERCFNVQRGQALVTKSKLLPFLANASVVCEAVDTSRWRSARWKYNAKVHGGGGCSERSV